MRLWFANARVSAIVAALLVAVLVTPASAAPLALSYSTIYDGSTIITTPTPGTGTINTPAVPGSHTYVNNFTAPTQTIPGTSYGFYDDFVFTISGATANAITTTIDIGAMLQITNLQQRLFSFSGNPSPTLFAPVGGVIDAWTNVIGTSGTVTVLPNTVLSAGTYVLQIRGNVIGTSGGSYAGVMNVAPVPLPAALPLLLSALSGFGLLARRRK